MVTTSWNTSWLHSTGSLEGYGLWDRNGGDLMEHLVAVLAADSLQVLLEKVKNM